MDVMKVKIVYVINRMSFTKIFQYIYVPFFLFSFPLISLFAYNRFVTTPSWVFLHRPCRYVVF